MHRYGFIFLAIFVAISLPVTFLLHRSWKHLEAEATFAYKEHAYLMLEMLNRRIIDDLAVEEQRSYSDYRFIKAVPVIGGEEITLSDLARYPVSSHYRGMIGHFQMEPDGSIKTPVLPDGKLEALRLDNRREREAVRQAIRLVLEKMNLRHTATVRRISARTLEFTLPQDTHDTSKELNLTRMLRGERKFVRRFETSSEKEAIIFDVESELPVDATVRTSPSREIGTRPEGILEVEIDPFQVRIDAEHLVFFRNVWRNDQRFMQGFVVHLRTYLSSIVRQDLGFGSREKGLVLEFGARDSLFLRLGAPEDLLKRTNLLMSSPLQFPLNELELSVRVVNLENLPGSGLIIGLGILILLVLGGGLFGTYKVSSTQMRISAKRQDFISAVSHELKTPLTAIRMYAEMLQNQWVASEEKRTHYYNMIAGESERLSRLIQNVLNLSNLDRNRWRIQLQHENPALFIADFVEHYKPTVERAGFSLVTKIDACKFEVKMDRDACFQILVNLVENSLKFANHWEPRQIELGLGVREEAVWIWVRDYGPGIPPSELNKVFDEFYRIENEMTRRTSGTGIGLSLVKKLSRLMGVRLRVSNANPGLLVEIHFPPNQL